MTVEVTAEAQLEIMENAACAGGLSDYERVRSEMWDALYAEYPGEEDFDLEDIHPAKVREFKAWLESEDD